MKLLKKAICIFRQHNSISATISPLNMSFNFAGLQAGLEDHARGRQRQAGLQARVPPQGRRHDQGDGAEGALRPGEDHDQSVGKEGEETEYLFEKRKIKSLPRNVSCLDFDEIVL